MSQHDKHRVVDDDEERTPSSTSRVEQVRPTKNRPPQASPSDEEKRALRQRSIRGLIALGVVAFIAYAAWIVAAGSFSQAASQVGAWLSATSHPPLSAYAVAFGPLVVLLAGGTAVLVRSGLPDVWKSVRRSALAVVLLGCCLLGVGLLSGKHLEQLSALPWLFFVPIVPPVLLAYQALVVWRQRPRSIGAFTLGVAKSTEDALNKEKIIERFDATYRQLLCVFGGLRSSFAEGTARDERSREPPRTVKGAAYGPAFFVANFAVPALLLLLVGFGSLSMAVNHGLSSLIDDSITHGLLPKGGDPSIAALAERGLRWGLAGAFVYVLVEFGSRCFRSDLTVGAAIWAIVTLIVGPILAVLLAVAWKLGAGASPWQSGVVLFVAGLAPRKVVTVVENAALQLLKAPNDAATWSKVVPLTSLRGLTPEIAARLREENIQDVESLAYADPVRLVQSLPFDLRQVIDWIDQAQLATALPKHYDILRDNGVTGAIDLAWRWVRAAVKVDAEGGATLKPDDALPAKFKALVNDVDRDAASVCETACQLFYEEQVRLLWVMYNCFSTTAEIADAEAQAAHAEADAELT